MNAKLAIPLIAAATLSFGAAAMASEGHGKEDIGQPGTKSQVTRTVEVKMGDVFFDAKDAPINLSCSRGKLQFS
ncbi:hypothetical protein CW309_31620, partial [Pseudomonas hunanensis]